MHVVERFSERAQRVIEVAEDEVRRLDHPYIGTEHLLLGLVADVGPTGRALVGAGATADATRDKVAEAVGRNAPRQRGGLEYSVRARRAVERASRLSLQRRDDHVEPEHLLIGVLDVEGRAGQVLRGLGVDVTSLRSAVDLPNQIVHIGGPRALAEKETRDHPRPTPQCAVCGTALERSLSYRIIEATAEEGEDGGGGGGGGGSNGTREFIVAYCSACGAALGVAPE